MKLLIAFICLCIAAFSVFNLSSTKKSSTTASFTELKSKQTLKSNTQSGDNDFYINMINNSTYAAHRGLVSKEPENSLIAFKKSKEMGFKIVETDLHLTKDSKWILMHDYTLDRTTNGKGNVRNLPLRKINKLRLINDKQDALFIPTLDEFLKLCSEENLAPILDIKPDETQISQEAYNDLFNTLEKYDLLNKSIICSYSKNVLSTVREYNNNISIAVMVDVNQENLDFVNWLENAFIYYNYKEMTEEKLKLLEENKVKFGVWTLDNKEEAEYFCSKGSILIVTDELLPN